MKLSTMGIDEVAEHCHVPADDKTLPLYWAAAKEYVMSYTGLDEEGADGRTALTVAALALAADMCYNRSVHIDNDKLNRVVESFLGAHDFNLLPGGA